MIITTTIIKGGTGKSTTAAALAQAAAVNNKRVLVVDMDPQANISQFLRADQNRPGAAELIRGRRVPELIQQVEQNIDVIAGRADLAGEVTKPGSAGRLRAVLEPIKGIYDYVIIDTPPTINELVYNALFAADCLLLPLSADISSLKGALQVVELAGHLQRRPLPAAAIVTRYKARLNLHRQILDIIKDTLAAENVDYFGEIREGVAIAEAQATAKNIFTYAKKSAPAVDYMAVYDKIKQWRT